MEELQPALLLLVGVAAAYAPGVPDSRLDPELVLVLFLPALLYSAALQSSVEGFRANARPIALLSVGLVWDASAITGTAPRLPRQPIGGCAAR